MQMIYISFCPFGPKSCERLIITAKRLFYLWLWLHDWQLRKYIQELHSFQRHIWLWNWGTDNSHKVLYLLHKQ